MTMRADDLRVRPGRIDHGNRGARRPQTFVGQVMRAAKRAGHVGNSFRSGPDRSRSRFGRGRRAAIAIRLRSNARRVVTKARVVRHRGTRFRSAPLSKHVAYLKREGVTRDGRNASMFDATSDAADERGFAERCEGDRHHFRFIISPEDGAALGDLKAFTRELLRDVEKDLATKLDWIAVDHWNTDNPHVHLLIRGRADDGQDLVISREYISRGLRDRAAHRITLELGPRSEQEVRTSLEREVEAERWTSLDRALREICDDCAGVADLRPGRKGEDPELRRLLLGRAAKLERLGLAEPIGPACWTLKAGLEQTLRQLGMRGDIIKTMHRAMSAEGREPDIATFALHGEEPTDPVLGRLVQRGLDDELKGTAYAIVAGVDGRTHHLRFGDLDFTGDAPAGAIVELRTYTDASGKPRMSLAVRSDLSIEEQVSANGATWLDRQLLAKNPPLSGGGFGAEVRSAMDERLDHLAGQGLVHRYGRRVVFARDLLATLQQRELQAASAKLSAETGLTYQPLAEGDHVTGIYRQRVTLASGRFAMIDDGLGFELVPWRPALEQHLGKQVSGIMMPGGRVDWNMGRKRGLGI
ncbi:relaxase/mobilization nuclease domain-containing protein [Bradyrhizobium sp. DASA03120]|uniref:relaxase/mobilization nuclease domain-containing protein n=1 Tax=Bradyrhizobium sp. SMVTL-02 TaxID=3395917 RepID=UPI003F715129